MSTKIEISNNGFLGKSNIPYRAFDSLYVEEPVLNNVNKPELSINIIDDLMSIGKSRPGTKVNKINGVVVHYTAAPNSTAKQIRDYFEILNTGGRTESEKIAVEKEKGKIASCHYTIGQLGEIIRLIPDNEISYTSGGNSYVAETITKLRKGDNTGFYPHSFIISYEACNVENATGSFTKACYDSQVKLCAYLLKTHKLTINDLYRHIDIVGTNNTDCPKFFNGAANPQGEHNWKIFKSKIQELL